jgi:hypothetical protein
VTTAYRDEALEALFAAHEMAEKLDEVGLVGYGIAEMFNGDGVRTLLVPFANLITDVGDVYYAQKGIVGISPANATAPTAVNGMKLGTGSTAVAKSGAGAALVTYLSASNVVFDATFPSAATLGAGLGANMTYKTTWAAGVATTASAITEVVIVNDQATNATTTAANTIARALLAGIASKGASDTLAVTWNHKALGS